MKLQLRDFNGADALFSDELAVHWKDISDVLTALPLQLKPSDQDGKQGSPIFDPVASNAVIKADLRQKGWPTNILIPPELSFLGTDVDFFRTGVLVEVQFSNYPFFLNNIFRSGFFAKSKTLLGTEGVKAGETVRAVVVVTKAHMFPSSNSTLYYEQAVNQLTALTKNSFIEMPIRLVGLFEDLKSRVPAVWNNYPGRYSRAPTSSENIECRLTPGTRRNSIICTIEIIPPR